MSEPSPKSETQRLLIQGSTLSAGVMLALALFGMVNYLALRHYQRFDWTRSKLYTLSEKSLSVARGIDRDLELVIFLNPASELYGAVDELLSRYAAANPQHIKKRQIDPAKNLLEARQLVEQHNIERDNVIVVATANDRRVLDEFELAEYDYSAAQYGQPPTLKQFKGEQLITSAILELVEARKPKILFTTGHGEAAIEAGNARSLSRARDLLGKDNFTLETWGSLGKSEVPAGTDLVVVAGPTSNFLPPELALFSRYLETGGRMLFLLDPVLSPEGQLVDLGLDGWLRKLGVALAPDIIIDPSQQLPFFGPETLFTSDFGDHPIVLSLQQTKTPVLFPLARSVSRAADAPGELEVTELVKSGAEAWGETDLERLDQVSKDEKDLGGPVALGVAVSFAKKSGGGADSTPSAAASPPASSAAQGARLVVLGDLDFATDGQLANAANGTLLLNAFNWLVQREQLIEVEARQPEQVRLNLTRGELTSIYFLVLGLLPALSIAFGVWVYYQRRR